MKGCCCSHINSNNRVRGSQDRPQSLESGSILQGKDKNKPKVVHVSIVAERTSFLTRLYIIAEASRTPAKNILVKIGSQRTHVTSPHYCSTSLVRFKTRSRNRLHRIRPRNHTSVQIRGGYKTNNTEEINEKRNG